MSLLAPALAGGFFTTSATWEAPGYHRGSGSQPLRDVPTTRMREPRTMESCSWRWALGGKGWGTWEEAAGGTPLEREGSQGSLSPT